MTEKLERRDFIKQATTTAAAAAFTASSYSKVLGANDRVRLGIIGPGDRGQQLMKEFIEAPTPEFAAAADVYTRRHEEVKKFGAAIKAFKDHRSLLEQKDVDAVIIATPLHCHARHFLDTLAAGKDMYCEKTMTWSVDEADACLAASRALQRSSMMRVSTTSSIGKLASAMCRRRNCVNALLGIEVRKVPLSGPTPTPERTTP